MNDLALTLSVIILFVLRIGVPVAVLVSFGVLVDRWQCHRETHFTDFQRR